MSMEEIFKTMQDLIAEQFALEPDEISMESSFTDDLGADSVDLVELVLHCLEDFFHRHTIVLLVLCFTVKNHTAIIGPCQ